jgi:HK97 family phage prohead protease
MIEELHRSAATARAAGVAARADRPSRRRCAEEAGSPARVSTRVQRLEVRANGTGNGLTFEGYASVYEQPYEMWDMFGPYTEVVSAGASAQSLARSDLDVPLVLQHQDLRRIARTTNGSLQLAETDEGLHVLAPELDPDDQDVAYIVPKLRSGLVDEMSFKFMITAGVWSPDYTEYRINTVDIHRGDVAIVGYGANPYTAGAGLRAAADPLALVRDLDEDQARAALSALQQRLGVRAGRSLITDADVALRTLP